MRKTFYVCKIQKWMTLFRKIDEKPESQTKYVFLKNIHYMIINIT